MRVTSKSQLLEEIEVSWTQLWSLVDSIELQQVVQRVRPAKQGSSKSIKDVLAHLHAWHGLLLDWIRTGQHGSPELPAPGYKWNQTPALNQKLFDQWKDVPYSSIRRRLKLSHRRVVKLTESWGESELLNVGIFAWTGKLSLAKYIAANTASHYRWAIKSCKGILKKIDASNH